MRRVTCSLLCLCTLAVVPQPAGADGPGQRPGVLVVAHGADAAWNAPILSAVAQVARDRPAEAAFLMSAHGQTPQAAYDRLAASGATSVIVVPLFISSHSPHYDEVVALTAPHAAPATQAHAGPPPLHGGVPIIGVSRALDAHPLVSEILIDRARALSVDPRAESLLLVAHGPNSDDEALLWTATMRTIGDAIRGAVPFRDVDVRLLRDDAPHEVKDRALAQLRQSVVDRTATGRVVVLPLLLSAGRAVNEIARVLDGLTFAWDGHTLLPDHRLATWITAQAEAVAAHAVPGPGGTPVADQAAGGTSRLNVVVRDSYGIVPGATVTAAHVESGQTVRGVTAEDGTVVLGGMPGGAYVVTASFPGFADATRRGVQVAPDGEASIDLTLALVQFSSQITVSTANRREQLLLDVADPTVLIDQGQIADTSARTAKDLLAEQSGAGIQVQAGGGQGYISLNGIPNSGVLVLVDGRRYLGKDANGNFNLEDLTLTGVDRVEVVKGAGSALYGSDALGGVVNFITKRSTRPGLTNALDVSGGSYGDWRLNDTAGWRAGRGGVTATAGYRRYDGFDLSEANPQTIGQPEGQWKNGDMRADFRIAEGLIARASADYSRRDIENYFFSGATQLASTVYDSQRQLTRRAVSPGLDYFIGGQTSVTVDYTTGKYLRDETRVFVQSGAVQPQAPWREWNDELRVSARHAWSLAGTTHPLQLGFERRREHLRRGTLTVADPSRDVSVFWFQQEVSLGARVRFAAGARYDDFSDFGREWSPKASLVVALAERHRLHASAGHGFRPPYFGELYLNTPPSFVGNPNLEPETGNTFNGGYTWAGARGQISGDYYRAKVEHGIVFDLSRMPFTYGNLRSYTSQGANVSASVTLPAGFTPSVSYAFNRREDAAGVEIGGYANHAAFVKLLWTNARLGWRANLRGQILGKVPPATDGSYQPAYQVWSAQVAKRVTTRGGHAVSLYLQGANLLDESDVFRRNAAGEPITGDFQVWLAPRTVLAGLTVDLDWTR